MIFVAVDLNKGRTASQADGGQVAEAKGVLAFALQGVAVDG